MTKDVNESYDGQDANYGFQSYRTISVDDVGFDYFYVSKTKEMRRLTAYVNSTLRGKFLDPNEAINHLRQKLTVVGLIIPEFSIEGEDSGEVELEVTQYPGYGVGEDGGVVPKAMSDNIPGGLYLVLNYAADGGMYQFYDCYFASGAELDLEVVEDDEEDFDE